MKTVRVKVTQEDIDNGHQGMAYSCPIALAFRRCGITAGVAHSYYGITHNETIYSGWFHFPSPYNRVYRNYPMSPLIQNWIKTFDNGGKVLPIEFTANVDPNYIFDKEIN